MMELVFKLSGGIGLFVLGMVLLTDGLKAFAGEALRRALVRFTGTPLKAFASGVAVTAIVQSSSATTVTVIGFVSAGLLTFPQAVGVVMGASLGTTGTGWIVAVLGLKVSVGFYALPLVGVGAFLKLLGRGRWRSLGVALAGLGLIFIGIETLQSGMQGLTAVVDFSKLPAANLPGHLLAMLMGVILTVLMQSSSAAVATTLTALHTGAVNFEQAASVTVGAAIGTTVTGVLATIGGTVPAKRTAVAHVAFNLVTGLVAIVLLPGLLSMIQWAQTHLELEPGALSLAAFHSTFIALGVILVLPFVDRFARAVERLLPEKGPLLTQHLDDSLLHVPAVALEATRRALAGIAAELCGRLRTALDPPARAGTDDQAAVLREALQRTEEFFARIPPVSEDAPLTASRLALVHAIDHLQRLQSRVAPAERIRQWWECEPVRTAATHGRSLLELATAGLRGAGATDWVARVEQHAAALAKLRRQERVTVLGEAAGGARPPNDAIEMLDALRWLDRVGYHTWRVVNYLAGTGQPEPASVTEENG